MSFGQWARFIGTMGGLLGLYVGVSFVSILEILECIVDMIFYGWKKAKHIKQRSKERVTPTGEFI